MSIKDKLELKEEETDKKQANYMALGMIFGVAAGGVGMAVLAAFGQIAWGGFSICFGMLAGMLIGMLIPKKK